MRAELATLALLAAAGVYLLSRRRTPGVTALPGDGGSSPGAPGGASSASWVLPPSGEPYRLTIEAAEGRYSIPRNLLARLLWQESHFQPAVISGQVVSSAGAVGIAQLIPRYFPGVDPRDPTASIWAAADYLASLKSRFGSWPLALAAYDWGPGNLQSAIDRAGAEWPMLAPAETNRYVSDITADVPA